MYVLTAMSLGDTVQAICEGLVSGIQYIASGVASGVKAFVTALIYNDEQTALSSFMSIIVVFGAVALAIAITTLVFNWIKNLGA